VASIERGATYGCKRGAVSGHASVSGGTEITVVAAHALIGGRLGASTPRLVAKTGAAHIVDSGAVARRTALANAALTCLPIIAEHAIFTAAAIGVYSGTSVCEVVTGFRTIRIRVANGRRAGISSNTQTDSGAALLGASAEQTVIAKGTVRVLGRTIIGGLVTHLAAVGIRITKVC
jgi:hypothetical protein